MKHWFILLLLPLCINACARVDLTTIENPVSEDSVNRFLDLVEKDSACLYFTLNGNYVKVDRVGLELDADESKAFIEGGDAERKIRRDVIKVQKDGAHARCAEHDADSSLLMESEVSPVGGAFSVVLGAYLLPFAVLDTVLTGDKEAVPSIGKGIKRNTVSSVKSDKTLEAFARITTSEFLRMVEADWGNPRGMERLMADFPILKDSGKFKRELLRAYRKTGDFDEYIRAFALSRDFGDLKAARDLARTDEQKKAVEKHVVEAKDPKEIFGCRFIKPSEKYRRTPGLDVNIPYVIGMTSQGGKVQTRLKVYPLVPLKWNDYVVTVKVTCRQEFRMDSGAPVFNWAAALLNAGNLAKIESSQDLEYILQRSSGHTDSKIVEFYVSSTVGMREFGINIFLAKHAKAHFDAEVIDVKVR